MLPLSGIAAVLLAAGLSRRYGPEDKLLVPLNGKPLAFHIADTLAAMDFSWRLAVHDSGNETLRQGFEERGFKTVANVEAELGLASSLVLGIHASMRHNPQAVLICLGDMPLVSARHLQLLAESFDPEIGVIASTRGDGIPTPPALFAPRHFPALLELTGDQGARSLLRQAGLVEAPAAELADFDTVEDFGRS